MWYIFATSSSTYKFVRLDAGSWQLLVFISNRNVPLVCLRGFIPSRGSLYAFGSVRLTSARLSSPWAVVLQFRFQASFISYASVTAFLIFQTNGHVSIAACQFWFYDSFIIKCVRLQCSAADGLLHFSHGQGMSLLYVCVGREDGLLAHVCVSPWMAFRFVLVMSEQMWVGTKHNGPSQTA